MSRTPVHRALLSVSDKRGIAEFGQELRRLGVEILSTGGTAAMLRAAGVDVVEMDAFTGFPEILDGRVKTLHPKVHGGILFRRDDPTHRTVLEEHGFEGIDLVAVNLYPFVETVARPGVTWDEAVEQIDIGGPTLIRSAAKNHAHVTIASHPDHYAEILAELRQDGTTSYSLRRRLATAAFRATAAYDAAIRDFFAREETSADSPDHEAELPQRLEFQLGRSRVLRYGENPHQAAALYGPLLDCFEQVHGRELSYNNLLDVTSALRLSNALGRRGPAVAIIKHSNPCGAAVSSDVRRAWELALGADPRSASGGVIASSALVDEDAARAMGDHFIEVLIAPAFAPEALRLLRRKKNRILLTVRKDAWEEDERALEMRSLGRSLLVQTPDLGGPPAVEHRVVTRREPSSAEMEALAFGWDVVPHVKSNAVIFTTRDRVVGVGAGQMSRVDAVHVAVMKARQAGIDLAGSVVASDAFFPFPDGIARAADSGATAAIQPGGSVRDAEVIKAADERGMAMVFTGRRHFRH